MSRPPNFLDVVASALIGLTIGIAGSQILAPEPDHMVCVVLTPAGEYYHVVDDDGKTHCREP